MLLTRSGILRHIPSKRQSSAAFETRAQYRRLLGFGRVLWALLPLILHRPLSAPGVAPASIEISEAPTGLSLQGDDAPVPFLLEVHTLPQGRLPLCEARCPPAPGESRGGAAGLPASPLSASPPRPRLASTHPLPGPLPRGRLVTQPVGSAVCSQRPRAAGSTCGRCGPRRPRTLTWCHPPAGGAPRPRDFHLKHRQRRAGASLGVAVRAKARVQKCLLQSWWLFHRPHQRVQSFKSQTDNQEATSFQRTHTALCSHGPLTKLSLPGPPVTPGRAVPRGWFSWRPAVTEVSATVWSPRRLTLALSSLRGEAPSLSGRIRRSGSRFHGASPGDKRQGRPGVPVSVAVHQPSGSWGQSWSKHEWGPAGRAEGWAHRGAMLAPWSLPGSDSRCSLSVLAGGSLAGQVRSGWGMVVLSSFYQLGEK